MGEYSASKRPCGREGIWVGAEGSEVQVIDESGSIVTNFDSGTNFYVSSVSGTASGTGLSWDTAITTVKLALLKCTAHAGDKIYISPDHVEDIVNATDLVINVIGVSIIGCGVGEDRPTFTVKTASTATIGVSVSATLKNCRVICGTDGVDAMITVTGDNVDIDVECRDTSAIVEANIGVLLTSVDHAKIKVKYVGFIAGDAVTNAVACTTCTNCAIDVDFYGIASTAIVEFKTAACHNMKVTGYFYNSGTTTLAKNVVDTITGSTWLVEGFDGAAGCSFSGGSGAAVAKDDVSAVSTALATLQAEISGTAGIASFPAVAAPANNVSLAEVIRAIYNQTALGTYYNNPNYIAVTADMTSATWNTVAAHEIATVTGAVRMIILPECTGTLTSAGSSATLILGDETTTNSLITSSDAENLATGEWWVDATITRTIITQTLMNNLTFCIANSKDVGYTVGTEALTGGSIVFHIWWVPINATGNVSAGAGGVL
jgi:hypothetical protein